MTTIAARPARSGRPSGPALLEGLSWSTLLLVLAFCVLAAVGVAVAPDSGAAPDDWRDIALAALVRMPAFLITGVTVLVTAVAVLNAAGRAGRERLWLAALAALLGCLTASVMRYVVGAVPEGEGLAYVGRIFVSWFVAAAALTAGCVLYLRARAAREEADATALRNAALEKQRAESRLRLLQAQIEPHFLFNTLSNIRRLCQNDAAGGRAMLAQLARYLRAALPKFRGDSTTLGDEIELISAYLGLQRMRMGERLAVALEVPPALAGLPVPPMMLATLVENAIKHGLGPLPQGGTIRVAAAREGDRLVLQVSDTGRGFHAESGSGMGLANIRARLAALYAGQAALQLQANVPQGVVATLVLPLPGDGAA
jgi:signal transduction histidine kinase